MNNSMAFDTPSGPGTFNGSSNKAAFAGADDQVDRVNAIFMPIFCAIAMIIIYLPARDFYAKRNFACFRLLMGLSKYRKTIGNTLSTSGSGMTSKYYVKLTIIALSIVIVWVPVQIFYTYLNIPREFHSYNYAEIHRPEDWNPIVYLPLSLDGQVQYNGWAAIAVAFLIFVYFGFNDEAVDTYRSWLVKLGMAKFWPSLKEPRLPQHSRRGSNSTGQSFTGRFDLVSKAMKYFDGGLKGSQDSTSNNGSAATRIAPKGSRGTMRTYSSGTMTDRTASTPSPQMLLVPQINSPHLYPTPGQFAPPAKRSFFSTFRTHVNIPIIHHKNQEASLRDDLKPCTRICKVCGRGCNFQDIEGQTQPWAPGSGCTGPNGVHALSTNIWSEANPNPKPPSIIDEKYEEDEVKMGTKAYRQRETAEYQEKQNVEMSGAVVVEKTMERTESNVRGGGV
ncbi:putative Pheromone a factor receptor [Glarea lozoyensis 74030]|uniref:Putative Pheromone a factor receptor n=1 Tax=Glarea lozoyensis (strain ATCC 74030 / MF5533) TaxID=1104152 RepID=H0EZ15_GLAL7|nr:putative Pheromone a factor receptor [Glarea lozoyensis 74030]